MEESFARRLIVQAAFFDILPYTSCRRHCIEGGTVAKMKEFPNFACTILQFLVSLSEVYLEA